MTQYQYYYYYNYRAKPRVSVMHVRADTQTTSSSSSAPPSPRKLYSTKYSDTQEEKKQHSWTKTLTNTFSLAASATLLDTRKLRLQRCYCSLPIAALAYYVRLEKRERESLRFLYMYWYKRDGQSVRVHVLVTHWKRKRGEDGHTNTCTHSDLRNRHACVGEQSTTMGARVTGKVHSIYK